MRIRFASLALFAATFAASASAQVQVFGGNAERASAFRVWFADNAPAGMVCIQYGQPAWNADYDKMLEAKGQSFRLGKDYWATFTTDVSLMIGDAKVPAGAYFLGLHCDKAGKFGIAVMDMAKSIKAKATPFDPSSWQVDMFLPLTHKKAEKAMEKLTISMETSKDDPMQLSLMLHWGNHMMHAPMQVLTEKKAGSKSSKSTSKASK